MYISPKLGVNVAFLQTEVTVTVAEILSPYIININYTKTACNM